MVRTRRRHRYEYNRHRYESDRILLAEFRFYNKTKKVITNKVLDYIEEQLLSGDKPHIFWTNDNFSKYGVGFKFIKKTINEITSIYIEINDLNVSFTTQQYCNCEYIFNKNLFISCELTEDQISLLSEFDISDINSNALSSSIEKNKCIILSSWEEIVNYLIVDNHFKNYSEDKSWENTISDIAMLFNITLDVEPNRYKFISGYGRGEGIHQILEVFERRIDNKNYRIALVAKIYYEEPDYKFIVITDNTDEYLYIDKGTFFLPSRREKTFYFDSSIIQTDDNGVYIINNQVNNEMLRNISQILNEEQYLITPMIYNFYSDRVMTDEKDDVVSEKQLIINQKYQKVLNEGKEIRIGNLRLTKNRISLINENFCIEFPDTFIDVIENFNKVRNAFTTGDARYNFNIIYENLLKISCLKIISMDNTHMQGYKNFKNISFSINGMKITVHKDNNRMKINGIFCRISDIYYILTKAICYRDIEEYNKYIKNVSYIGIDWMKMISNGIMIELKNPFYSIFKKTGKNAIDKMLMRFSLLWDANSRSTVYLVLNETKYLIKYKGKFKKFFNYPRRTLSMERLKTELMESIENLDDKVLLEIIDNAIKEAVIIQKRGQDFVAKTVKEIGAVDKEIETRNGKMSGYQFIGRMTKAVYFINKIDLSVWREDNGAWNRRCIVDDSQKNRIFEDKLANRLINIYNEPAKLEGYL